MKLARARLDALRKDAALQTILSLAPGPVYLVGGTVRDLLLGRPFKDLDLALPGRVGEVASQAADELNITAAVLGKPPLQVYRLSSNGLILDLCPLEGPDIETDLKRRDLTINALALDLKARDYPEPVDPCGGMADLQAKTARFVSEENVLADPLRLLRFFRIMAELKLTPDPESLALAGRRSHLITGMASERLREEFLALLAVPRSWPALSAMIETGLLESLIPEITPLRKCPQGQYHQYDAFEHTLAAFRALEEILADLSGSFSGLDGEIQDYLSKEHRTAVLKMAVLCHDLGKPDTRTVAEDGEVHFFGHEEISRTKAMQAGARFKLSRAEAEFLHLVVGGHMLPFHLWDADRAGTLSSRGVYRFGRRVGEGIWAVAAHALADAVASQGPAWEKAGGLNEFQKFLLRLLREIAHQAEEVAKAPRLVSAEDLMEAFNLKQGPIIGELLDSVKEAQAVGRARDRASALALVAELLDQGGQGE